MLPDRTRECHVNTSALERFNVPDSWTLTESTDAISTIIFDLHADGSLGRWSRVYAVEPQTTTGHVRLRTRLEALLAVRDCLWRSMSNEIDVTGSFPALDLLSGITVQTSAAKARLGGLLCGAGDEVHGTTLGDDTRRKLPHMFLVVFLNAGGVCTGGSVKCTRDTRVQVPFFETSIV